MGRIKFLYKWLAVALLGSAGVPSWAQGALGKSVRGISGVSSQKVSLTQALARAGRTSPGVFPAQALPWARSVFRARPKGHPHEHAYSGTVFQIQWQGQKEVYGVIASHTISPGKGEVALKRFFTAEVFKDGQFVSVPAEVVQASSAKMLDVALVKFRPEDEKLFLPLTLAAQEPAQGAALHSLGFSNNQLIWLPERTLVENTAISLRTDMSVLRPERYGLCGSPLLNEKGELVAIHTGSSHEMDPAADKGFGTKALYLRTLVQAYHNRQGRATFPLCFGERCVAELNADEFISHIWVKDEQGNIIFDREVDAKFPHSVLRQIIPHARHVELSVNRVQWAGDFLIEAAPFSPRFVKYDVKEKEVVAPEER